MFSMFLNTPVKESFFKFLKINLGIIWLFFNVSNFPHKAQFFSFHTSINLNFTTISFSIW